MTLPVAPLRLLGSRVLLEPMRREHFSALLAVATADRSTFALTNVPSDEAELSQYMATAEREYEQRVGIPFVVVDLASQRVVGSTRFNHIQRWADPSSERWDAVEIGWTWLSIDSQRSGINREMKWLMLQHAFEIRNARRVSLKTDARNARSRAAILGIGAVLEGVLRNFGPASDGPVRDVAMFAIIDRDWPEVSARLRPR